MLAFWIIMPFVVWFGSGLLYSGRAAANSYQYGLWAGPSWGHGMKSESARAGWWASIFVGPLVMLYWFFKLRVNDKFVGGIEGKVQRALRDKVPEVRKRYEQEQERKMAELIAENDRLTQQILTTQLPTRV